MLARLRALALPLRRQQGEGVLVVLQIAVRFKHLEGLGHLGLHIRLPLQLGCQRCLVDVEPRHSVVAVGVVDGFATVDDDPPPVQRGIDHGRLVLATLAADMDAPLLAEPEQVVGEDWIQYGLAHVLPREAHRRHLRDARIDLRVYHLLQQGGLLLHPHEGEHLEPESAAHILYSQTLVVAEDGSATHGLNIGMCFQHLLQQKRQVLHLVAVLWRVGL
mmetsp:Transcript_162885/g.522268  ORF Transcript_162885/g.522268 Transcript_162885/m.522268 type:complete len:218 (+) Transcript_162885:1329-1982(+)